MVKRSKIKRLRKSHYHQGLFKPRNPQKYVGDPNNIVFRSSWELKVLCKLDSEPNVVAYSSEELIVPYHDPATDRNRRYFPDFVIRVRLPDGSLKTLMIEVKPESQAKKPVRGRKKEKTYINESLTFMTNQAKWKAAREFCAKKGWEFKVMTERDLGL